MSVPIISGVEWNSTSPMIGTGCEFDALGEAENVATGFGISMALRGHSLAFAFGNANARATDFDHPDFGGDSLNGIDNVHMAYFSGHGFVTGGGILFASNHNSCASFFASWRLGVKKLRWLVLDCCDAVKGTDNNSVIGPWDGPSQGVHIIFTLVGNEYPSFGTGRGSAFANTISDGGVLAHAWLDAAFSRSGADVNRPIAIAFGASREEANQRLESETLSARDLGPVASNWLAWKWRG